MSMNKVASASVEITVMLRELAEDIVSLMIREHQSINRELDHVSRLVTDASTMLRSNFDELNRIATQQPEAKRVDANVDAQFKKNQLNIVTALQFDDIVQQLTKHAQNRTRHIQRMFSKLATSIEQAKALNYEYTQSFYESIQTLKQEVSELRTELEKENPVKQTSLVIGKTELF